MRPKTVYTPPTIAHSCVRKEPNDSRVCLWDVVGAKAVVTYEGALQQAQRTGCCFSHDESSVLSADETTADVLVWDARGGSLAHRCKGHTGVVTNLAHSPVEPALLTLGDGLVRGWAPLSPHTIVE